jgi:transcriptional regulator with XRE-family HTH domain
VQPNRIREIRHQAGLSAAGLADLLEITESGVTAIERGDRNPSLKLRRKLAQVLNATNAELFPAGVAFTAVNDFGLALFEGRCGHRWIGAADGEHSCAVCARSGFVSMAELPVQIQDNGTAWARIASAAAIYPTAPEGLS